jgi:hypothetical protein
LRRLVTDPFRRSGAGPALRRPARRGLSGEPRVAFVAALLLLAAFGARADGGGEAPAPSWSKEIQPILNRRCVVCHMTGAASGGLELQPKDAWANLVGVKSSQSALRRVEPGDPGKSYLLRKLEGTHLEAGGEGFRMPQANDPLEPAEIELFRAWIRAGARKD